MENENKLPPDFKAKWVEALRSGKYKQCTSELSDEYGRFCCLGVACIVAGHTHREMVGYGFVGNIEKYNIKFLNTDLVPSMLHGNDGIAFRLQQMNDVGKRSFSEIADYIEQNL